MRRAFVLAPLLLGGVFLFGDARARAAGFDGERFVPAAGAAGGLQLERPIVPAHLGYGLGLFLNLADDAVVTRDRITGAELGKPLDRAFSADLIGSIGLFDFAELAVQLPVRLVYAGDAAADDGATLDADAGLGDVRIVPKVSFGWLGDETGGAAFGFIVPVSLPTGRAAALRGAGVVTVEPRFLAMAYGTRWLLGGSAGFRLRADESAAAPGDELTFGLGLTYTLPLAPSTLVNGIDLMVEGNGGYLSGVDSRGQSALPIEALAAVAVRPSPRWTVYLGGGVGMTNGLGVPDARGFLGIRYAVGVPGRGGARDRDTDGVRDAVDKCPTDAEDLDGFQDDDGCPEEDNDKDGIGDDDDECPDDAEEPGGDKDGCPDRPRVVVRKGKLVVYGKVLFPLESAEIRPQSEALIDEMARALKDHPQIRRLEIAGHTDDTGPEALNETLSRERAEAVKTALVRKGIAAGRLVPRGHGESQPVAPNVTKAGRAKNRRVEFTILD